MTTLSKLETDHTPPQGICGRYAVYRRRLVNLDATNYLFLANSVDGVIVRKKSKMAAIWPF